MTTDEIEASQSGVDDGGMGGPGAPTPLSALEVCAAEATVLYPADISYRELLVLRREIFN